MAKIASNTPGVVTVYDEDGKASVCALVDAKERVATGRWTYEPPVLIVREAPSEPISVPLPVPIVEKESSPEEVNTDAPRSGGRKRAGKR